MTAAEHHAMAEQLLADGLDERNGPSYRAELREAAQVHATLALAAAVAGDGAS